MNFTTFASVEQIKTTFTEEQIKTFLSFNNCISILSITDIQDLNLVKKIMSVVMMSPEDLIVDEFIEDNFMNAKKYLIQKGFKNIS